MLSVSHNNNGCPENALPENALQKLLSSRAVWVGSKAPIHLSPTKRPKTSFGIPTIDAQLPEQQLSPGQIHELSLDHPLGNRAKGSWFPPLFILAPIIRNVLHQVSGEYVVWIGKRCWPAPPFLERLLLPQQDQNLQDTNLQDITSHEPISHWLPRLLFIDATSPRQRLSATIDSLRCPCVAAVIADGSSLDMTATRRLQLAAQRGSSLGLLLRPPWEIERPSAAATRWRISPQPSPSFSLQWKLELLRCKGGNAPLIWFVETAKNETNSLCASSQPADRLPESSTASGSARNSA